MKKIILLLCLSLNLIAYDDNKDISNLIILDEADRAFDYLGNVEPVALMVFMEGCGPCKELKPKLNELAKEGKKVLAINYENAESLVKQYKISGFPTVLIFEPGKTHTDKIVRGGNIAEIKKLLDSIK